MEKIKTKRKSTQLLVCMMARPSGRFARLHSARSDVMSFAARRINHVNAARVIKAERLFIACNCVRGSADARRITPCTPSIFDEVTAEAGEVVAGGGGLTPPNRPPSPFRPLLAGSVSANLKVGQDKTLENCSTVRVIGRVRVEEGKGGGTGGLSGGEEEEEECKVTSLPPKLTSLIVPAPLILHFLLTQTRRKHVAEENLAEGEEKGIEKKREKL